MDVLIFLVDVLMFLVFDREQGRMHVHIQREVAAQQHAGLLQVVVPALRCGWRRKQTIRPAEKTRRASCDNAAQCRSSRQ